MKELLKTLSECCAPSGLEGAAVSFVESALRNRGLSPRRDRLGNLLAEASGAKRPSEPVFLTAHLDEPGFMVTEITQEGLLRFDLTGDTALRTILGRQALVGEKQCRGVVGLKPIHLTTKEERKTLPKLSGLYMDIGAPDRAAAEKLVSVGDFGVFSEPWRVLGENRILGKAMGRAVGCAALLSLLEEPLPVDVTLVFTLQRHAGSRGAYGAAGGLSGGVCLTLDLCPAGGTDGPEPGKGPAVPAMDKGAIYNSALRKAVLSGAKARGVPVQPIADGGAAGDAGIFQRACAGFSAATLCCPARYLTAPSQMIALEDAEMMPQVLRGFLEELSHV